MSTHDDHHSPDWLHAHNAMDHTHSHSQTHSEKDSYSRHEDAHRLHDDRGLHSAHGSPVHGYLHHNDPTEKSGLHHGLETKPPHLEQVHHHSLYADPSRNTPSNVSSDASLDVPSDDWDALLSAQGRDLDALFLNQEATASNDEISNAFQPSSHSMESSFENGMDSTRYTSTQDAGHSHHTFNSQTCHIGDDSRVFVDRGDGDTWVGKVKDQCFYTWEDRYAGYMDTNLRIHDASGDVIGYVDNNFDVRRPNGTFVTHCTTALGGAAYMIFCVYGGAG